ncbi:MAG TPA: hypothetical protein VEQ59_08100, partial [Polyangiaceae bacterium]|nr:hypothetical protein [Polyangiaceae bacterium]
MIQTRAQQEGLPHTLIVSSFIAGAAAPPGATFERRNPANRDDVVTVATQSTRQQVFEACEVARGAAGAWA